MGIIQSIKGLNRTKDGGRRNSVLFFPASVGWAGISHLIFSGLWTWTELHPYFSWVSNLQVDDNENHPFLASEIYTYTHTYSCYWVSGELWPIQKSSKVHKSMRERNIWPRYAFSFEGYRRVSKIKDSGIIMKQLWALSEKHPREVNKKDDREGAVIS